jgi:hypothetical protein
MERRDGRWRPGAAERGSALVAVLAIITAVLLIGSALFIMGVGEGGLVEDATDSARAFWLAEAGQERARTWLEEGASQQPPVYPLRGGFEDQPLAGGVYDGSILTRFSPTPWLYEYDVVTVGEHDGNIRQVRTVLRTESFSRYVYFHNQSSDIWHVTGDSLDGPFHANGHIRIRGEPWFGGRVSTTEDYLIVQSGSNPIFERGYTTNAPAVPFPDPDMVPTGLRAAAQSQGHFAPSLRGNRARYEVVLGRNGNLGYLSYRSYERRGSRYRYSPWTDVAVSGITGPVWFDDTVWIEGTLDGVVTIGTAEDVHIRDDILYEDATPRGGPVPGCDDMLGLISSANVIVDITPANMRDCVIHGHVMALQHSLTAERYNQGPPRGDLVVWGGIAQENTGPVGAFNEYDIIVHGYTKDYHYDVRLNNDSPPWYPLTGRYYVASWEDVWPPEL